MDTYDFQKCSVRLTENAVELENTVELANAVELGSVARLANAVKPMIAVELAYVNSTTFSGSAALTEMNSKY